MAVTNPPLQQTNPTKIVRPRSRAKSRQNLVKNLLFGFLLLFTIFYMMPFFGALITSVRTMDDITLNGFWSIPTELTFSNYQRAWENANVDRYMLNSFIITIPALIATIFLSSLSAYALARHKFRGNKFLYLMYVAGTMLPFQILLLPVFLLSNRTGLYDTYAGVILIHVAFQLGFCTFVLRNFMRTIPGDILDAAYIDGCSEWGIFSKMVMPLTVPGIAAVATLEFTWIFNDYLWALILLSDDAKKPITAGLSTLQGQFVTDWPLIVAGALIGAVPTLIVFFALQRYFIGGLTLGAVK